MAHNMAAISHAIRSNALRGIDVSHRTDATDEPTPEEEEAWEVDSKWKMVLAKSPSDEECIFSGRIFKQKSCTAISKYHRKAFGGTKVCEMDAFLTESLFILSKPRAGSLRRAIKLERIY